MSVASYGAEVDPWTIHRLPKILIDGRPVRIHTQGLYVTDDYYWVTGRLETERRRALLLRFSRRDLTAYEYVDITPPDQPALDHPGGFDRDAMGVFWIPVSTSHPRGPTVVYGFDAQPNRSLESLVRDRKSFRVQDHVGALACLKDKRLLAANWDTRDVYVLSTDGKVLNKQPRSEFLASKPDLHLAVQDWKCDRENDQVIAAGIDKSPTLAKGTSQAVVARIELTRGRVQLVRIADRPDVSRPMTNEGMAVRSGETFLLPEDIGAGAKVLHRKSKLFP